ncbi:unnamed protein product [Mycena citricolor]|uniref:Cytochrome P450 n=1 Tax=Mycena citricolor TaxID=2018698 RepID=A0AAD2I0P0_9AGAR|nr:unnamed protein product [Mycena citricolor]
MEFTLLNLLLFLPAVALCHKFLYRSTRRSLPLPPGPPKKPLIGNLLDLPANQQWLTFAKWSKQYDSDIIHVSALGTSIVVLSSPEAVKELFEKRSAVYSSRVQAPMVNELMGWGGFIGFLPYGARWRSHRKAFMQAFNPEVVKQFYSQQRNGVHSLLRRILAQPNDDVIGQFWIFAAGIIMDIAYGIKIRTSDDQYVSIVAEAVHGLSVASVPGAFLVDIIPPLKYIPRWVPGAGFKREAQKWCKATMDAVEMPFSETKRMMSAGTASASYSSLHLRTLEDPSSTLSPNAKIAHEEVVKYTAAAMYVAGVDTVVSALGTFVIAMLLYPDVQRAAQQEIDEVWGHGNLPDFSEDAEERMPYLGALIKEVLRWRNITAVAIPHQSEAEDEYKGYRIPKGSVVIGNTWAILHDEVRMDSHTLISPAHDRKQEMYSDPDTFKPERFLLNGKLNKDIRDPEAFIYGYGRRHGICPGRYMASNSLWLTIGSLLSMFDFVKTEGTQDEGQYGWFWGLISTPLPFKCTMRPRSDQTVAAIRATEI